MIICGVKLDSYWLMEYQIRVTVEPLNKGHIGIRSTVPCREAVLISEDKVDGSYNLYRSCPYFIGTVFI